MKENIEEYIGNDKLEVEKATLRFEQMLKRQEQYYFDVYELENIIDYYFEKENIEKVSLVVNFALKLHPSSIDLKIKNALLLISQEQFPEALDLLNNLERIEPSNIEIIVSKADIYRMTGNIKKAINLFNQVIDDIDENKDEFLYDIALLFEQSEQYKIASKYLEQAYKCNSKNLLVIYELAYCCEKLGRDQRSSELYEKYLEEDPFDINVWYNLGITYNKLNRNDDAIEAYDYTIALSPKFKSAYLNKAVIYTDIQQYNKAIEVYNEYIDSNGIDEKLYCYIGECYQLLKDYTTALKYYKNALDLNKGYAEAWFGVGQILIHNKNYIESLIFISRAIKLNSKNPDYWFILGNVNLKLNYLDDADIAYRKATELDPYDCENWINYSYLKYKSKKLTEAINTLQAGYEHNPDDASINYRMAAYYMKNDNAELGFFHFENALSINQEKIREFLDFYPTAQDNHEINTLIRRYIKE